MADDKQITPLTSPGQAPPTEQLKSKNKLDPAQTPEENREPKMSITEIVFITPFYLISDGIDLTLFFFGLDDFGIMDTVRTSISQFYFVVLKKMGPEIWLTNLIIGSIKFFPYIGSLVPASLLWFAVVFIDRAGMAKIEKIIQATGKLGGAVKIAGEKIKKI